MFKFFVLMVCLIATSEWATAGKVLLLPSIWPSHLMEMKPVAAELTRRGHQVFMIMPITAVRIPKSLIQTGVKFIRYQSTNVDPFDDEYMKNKSTQAYLDFKPDEMHLLQEVGNRQCKDILGNRDLTMKLLKLEVDLILIDPFIPSLCLYTVAKRIDKPVAALTSLPSWPWLPAFARFPSLSQSVFCGGLTEWGFLNRLINTMYYFQMEAYFYTSEYAGLAADLTDVWFIEADALLDAPRLSSPNVHWIGGLTGQPPSPLPARISSFVESSTEGFVLVAFGSKLNNLGRAIHEKMIKAFGMLKQKVIWKAKSEYEGVDNLPDNVLISSWLPQNDLLGHPKCRAVLLHCGNNGMYEALYHGVPMIGNPAIGDQPFNCRRLKNKQFGMTLDVRIDDVDRIYKVIKEVIDNPVYRDNIKRASELRKSLTVSPVDEIINTMELMMKYGTDHLKFPPSDLNVFQIMMLDIQFCVLAAGICFFTITKWICRKCCCYRKEQQIKLKKKCN